MRKRLLSALVTGLVGGVVAALAWWVVFTQTGSTLDPIYTVFLRNDNPERWLGGGGFLLGCVGGLWLGRDQPHPFGWMLAGGAIVGATGLCLASLISENALAWPMVAIPAAAGFLAAGVARAVPDRSREGGASNISLAAHISWTVPRLILIIIAIVLAIFLWPARFVFVPSLYAILGAALAVVAIVQESRIRRLEQRVNELAK